MKNELFDKVEYFQNLLIEFSTGGEINSSEYNQLRSDLLNEPIIKEKLPEFLKSRRNTEQFWHFIKMVDSSYAGRREFLWSEFSKTLEYLESFQETPAEKSISEIIGQISEGYIKSEWQKALKRKIDDPEGAITTSRTLIETVCKHILQELNVEFDNKIKLPQLYKLTAKQLNLAPDQHTENIFKQILNGCQSVVEGLGTLRNQLSDSHGKKIESIKPSTRHAELAVNLAGTMTVFLFETFENNNNGG